MGRALSKQPPLQISANPIARQEGEPPIAYELFQHWIAADGNRSFAEIAVSFEKKPDTVRRYAATWRWGDRLELLKAARNEPSPLVTAEGNPTRELEQPTTNSRLDPIAIRIESALEVAEHSYQEAASLHKRLFAVAKTAAENLTADDIRSITELRQVVQLTSDLAKTKTDLSSHINGIEELAKAVQRLRKKK